MNNSVKKVTQLSFINKYSLFTIVAIVFILLTTGCSTYQYASLNSDLQKNENNAFVNENDTVRIIYSFSGHNCPVKIHVYNKLDKPIYIDWSKSAVILNDEKISYWSDKSVIKTSSSGTEYQWTEDFSTTHSSTEGAITRDERISFLPPKSYVKISRTKLSSKFYNIEQKDSLRDEYIATTNGSAKWTNNLFNETNTPLTFRSFITLSLSDDFSKAETFDNQFWIESVARSSYSPKSIIHNPENRFYSKKTTTGGKVFGWITAIGLLTVLAIYGGDQ